MSKIGNRRSQSQKPHQSPGVTFETFQIPADDHAAFKAAVIEKARKGLAAYPDALTTLRDQLKSYDPLDVVATFAAYGLRAYVSNAGVEEQKGLPIQQHHAELLQAIMLGMPVSQWGAMPITPSVMQVVFDTIPVLTDAFQYNRLLERARIKDKAESLVRSLQGRMALHTQGVRNWGYFGDVVRLSIKLFSPLDPAFREHLAFSASDLITILQALVAEFEQRQSEHFSVLKKVFSGKSPQQMARNYYKYVPDLEGTPDDFVAAMAGAEREQVMAVIMSHFDLRLAGRATFTSQQLAELTGVSEVAVQAAMKAISLAPGALASEKPEHLFLTNPTGNAHLSTWVSLFSFQSRRWLSVTSIASWIDCAKRPDRKSDYQI